MEVAIQHLVWYSSIERGRQWTLLEHEATECIDRCYITTPSFLCARNVTLPQRSAASHCHSAKQLRNG